MEKSNLYNLCKNLNDAYGNICTFEYDSVSDAISSNTFRHCTHLDNMYMPTDNYILIHSLCDQMVLFCSVYTSSYPDSNMIYQNNDKRIIRLDMDNLDNVYNYLDPIIARYPIKYYV